MNIPKGFKLVPTQLTDAMREAALGVDEWAQNEGQDQWKPGQELIWEELLSAAPTPPQPIYEEAKERELFEAWSANHYYLGGCEVTMEDGEYKDPDMQYSWESWEARAKSVEVGDE